MITQNLSNKDIVRDILHRLPDEVSLHQIAEQIEFVSAVRQGIAELDQGQEISLDDIAKELPTWLIK